MRALLLATGTAWIALCAAACPAGDGGADAGPQPTLSALRTDLFEARCSFAGCHGGAGPAGNLDLVTDPRAALVDVDSDEDPAIKRVVAGDPDASLLFQVLNAQVGNTSQMPEVGCCLSAEDIERVRTWIENGALDD